MLFHLHLLGKLVVVLVEHIHLHIDPVTHDLLWHVLGRMVRDRSTYSGKSITRIHGLQVCTADLLS